MKKVIFILSVFILSSCSRSCQSWKRDTFDNVKHKIKLTHYSGGKEVGVYEFNGIVNSSEHSDGYFFYVDGKLIEVSGDVKIEYLD